MRRRHFYPTLLTAVILILAGAIIPAHGQGLPVVYNFGNEADDALRPVYSGIMAQGRSAGAWQKSNTTHN